jgi:hypothetical protein
VAAFPHNAKCERFFSPAQDGLKQQWQGVCWMNPPYGLALREWMRKARSQAQPSSASSQRALMPAGGMTT